MNKEYDEKWYNKVDWLSLHKNNSLGVIYNAAEKRYAAAIARLDEIVNRSMRVANFSLVVLVPLTGYLSTAWDSIPSCFSTTFLFMLAVMLIINLILTIVVVNYKDFEQGYYCPQEWIGELEKDLDKETALAYEIIALDEGIKSAEHLFDQKKKYFLIGYGILLLAVPISLLLSLLLSSPVILFF